MKPTVDDQIQVLMLRACELAETCVREHLHAGYWLADLNRGDLEITAEEVGDRVRLRAVVPIGPKPGTEATPGDYSDVPPW